MRDEEFAPEIEWRHNQALAKPITTRALPKVSERVIASTGQALSPVWETTFYPAQFPVLLRDRMQRKTIAEAAEALGIPSSQFLRLLSG